MALVPGAVHLLGMTLFGVIHAVIRTMLRFGMAVLVFGRPGAADPPGRPET